MKTKKSKTVKAVSRPKRVLHPNSLANLRPRSKKTQTPTTNTVGIRVDKIQTVVNLQNKVNWEVDNYERALIPTHIAFKNALSELTRDELLYIIENHK